MKPHVLLRAASALTAIHALLHTFGGMLAAPSHGPKEIAVLDAMKAFRFDAMGTMRTYWEFYFGFGLFLTASLLILAVLLWQLAALSKSDPIKARPLMATVSVGFAAFAVLSRMYFFNAPLVVEGIISLLVGVAVVMSGKAA